jgi:hypothetical protein
MRGGGRLGSKVEGGEGEGKRKDERGREAREMVKGG